MTAAATIVQPELGSGIYSIPEASMILNMPITKVRRWVNKYWEYEFLNRNSSGYTWGEKSGKAFNFYTLIELIAVDSFRELGVPFSKIKFAHADLTEILGTAYPFAHAKLMTDGNRIFLDHFQDSILEMDKTKQFSFTNLVAPYCKKIDFKDNTQLAQRFWPLGKNHHIVVDPHHSFGQPVIKGTNITVDTISNLLNAGESAEFISSIYELEESAVEDVIAYMKRNAA
ncbi:MAG: DUF433 domain-containing protein [Balneolaceae bacterium]|nr:DUF433 domain-containing protein [Balneolaceae bacterium]